MFFSLGLYTLINKPSRITEYLATLIDNILTNDICTVHNSGLLINDISDHCQYTPSIKHTISLRIKSQIHVLSLFGNQMKNLF